MKTIVTLGFAVAAFAGLTLSAAAQNQLNRNEIVGSLQELDPLANKVAAATLRQQALDNIKNYPGTDAPANRPLSQTLSTIRQFNIEINFDLGSDVIQPRSYRTIGLIADALHTPYLAGQQFLVIGHTDSTGSREFNLELSQKRADAVALALVTTFRVDPELIIAVGLGEEQLRDSANPTSGVNRRVQLVNLGYPPQQ